MVIDKENELALCWVECENDQMDVWCEI